MKVKNESEVVQLCPTRSDPIDCSLPGSSIHGIFQARVLEGHGEKIHLRSMCYSLQLILISESSEESIRQGQWRAEDQERGKVRENRKQINKK